MEKGEKILVEVTYAGDLDSERIFADTTLGKTVISKEDIIVKKNWFGEDGRGEW